MVSIRPDVHERFLRILKRVEAAEAHLRKTVLKPSRQESVQWRGTPIRKTRGKLAFLGDMVPEVNEW